MGPLVIMAAAAAQLASPGVAASAPAAPVCTSAPFSIGGDVDVIKAWRVFVGKDGTSQVEPVTLPGKRGNFYGGAVKLTLWDLGQPTKAGMVFGQPNIAIPVHPAPGREVFVILAGSSKLIMADGRVVDLVPGTLLIADDVGAAKGRGGAAGPCGYVALDLSYATTPLPLSNPSP